MKHVFKVKQAGHFFVQSHKAEGIICHVMCL